MIAFQHLALFILICLGLSSLQLSDLGVRVRLGLCIVLARGVNAGASTSLPCSGFH